MLISASILQALHYLALKKKKKEDAKILKPNHHVVVMEPKTNTLLNGPKAPMVGNLLRWLQSHNSYHVLMPRYRCSIF